MSSVINKDSLLKTFLRITITIIVWVPIIIIGNIIIRCGHGERVFSISDVYSVHYVIYSYILYHIVAPRVDTMRTK